MKKKIIIPALIGLYIFMITCNAFTAADTIYSSNNNGCPPNTVYNDVTAVCE